MILNFFHLQFVMARHTDPNPKKLILKFKTYPMNQFKIWSSNLWGKRHFWTKVKTKSFNWNYDFKPFFIFNLCAAGHTDPNPKKLILKIEKDTMINLEFNQVWYLKPSIFISERSFYWNYDLFFHVQFVRGEAHQSKPPITQWSP